MMDRNLAIALVSAALVFAMGYGIGRRIFEGYTAIQFVPIRRANDPKTFRLIIGVLIMATTALAALSAVFFARWISN